MEEARDEIAEREEAADVVADCAGASSGSSQHLEQGHWGERLRGGGGVQCLAHQPWDFGFDCGAIVRASAWR